MSERASQTGAATRDNSLAPVAGCLDSRCDAAEAADPARLKESDPSLVAVCGIDSYFLWVIVYRGKNRSKIWRKSKYSLFSIAIFAVVLRFSVIHRDQQAHSAS
jgi:hypothetical protein